jgi:hypothetical protein
MNNLYLYPFLSPLLFFLFSGNGYRTRIIKTAVVNFAPQIKQHHIVIVEEYNRILYAIDFTPQNQSSLETLTNLALGRDVPAEVRVKYITNTDFYNDDGIIKQWLYKPCIPSPFPRIDNWDSDTMNLYTHNCQHFSSYMGKNNDKV